MTDSAPFRTFLEAMANDEDTSRGGVAAYTSLDAAGRELWIAHIEFFARTPGAPIGLAILSLLAAEDDDVRKRRLLACATEPPFALCKADGSGTWWKLVRPLGCEFASVASIRLDPTDRVLEAHYEPFARSGWDEGFEGASLGDAVQALAHAVVRDATRLRPVLLPFVELFSTHLRVTEAAA